MIAVIATLHERFGTCECDFWPEGLGFAKI
jgi:hypothetical protein